MKFILLTIKLDSEEDTIILGRRLAKLVYASDVITLSGKLGAGKTVLARGLIQSHLKSNEIIASPTFTLLNIYDSSIPAIWHFDLYRLEKSHEIEELGLDEALISSISIIEWPEIAKIYLPQNRLEITLVCNEKDNNRTALLKPSDEWKQRLEKLNK
tara:strand:- start:2 stop:472 length:471 start_codon:yes stop_codon:yes gene_type:complete